MPLISRISIGAGVCGSLILLAFAVCYAGFGLDITDESFYLIWTGAPYEYVASVSQFGFAYHPLDLLLGGNIAELRIANIILTFGLAWVAGSIYLREAYAEPPTLGQAWALGGVFASSSLAIFQVWLPTPNYNTLAFQSCLLAVIGLCLIPRKPASGVVGWLILAFGGWLAFLAKPTTAFALGVLSVPYLLLAGKLRMRGILVGLAFLVGLALATAFSIDGSVLGFLQRIRLGLDATALMGAGHGLVQMLRLDPWAPSPLLINAFAVLAFFIAFSAALLAGGSFVARAAGALLIVVSTVVVLLVVLRIVEVPSFGDLGGMLLFATVPGTIAACLWMRARLASERVPARSGAVVNVLICLLVPVAYVFGTNNNYWSTMPGAAYFWVLAAAGLGAWSRTCRPTWTYVMSAGVAAQIVTAMLLHNAMATPYRQAPPLWSYSHSVTVGAAGSRLLMSEQAATYIKELQGAARLAGFTAGQPLIDLSGRSPGSLYILGANAVGLPWLIGGYPGSTAFVQRALDAVSCDVLARAWLLIEPGTPYSMPDSMVGHFGAVQTSDYAATSEITVPPGFGARGSASRQWLLKPLRAPASAAAACQAQRQLRLAD